MTCHNAPRLPDLPIRKVLPRLARVLAEERSGVLVAPPGAGKTTLVPLALLGSAWLGDRKILVLEPRRLAARAAARRMSRLLGESGPGGTVGYRVRRDVQVGSGTRIEVVTEGILTRMLVSDPSLPEVGAVFFDEFHERSIHADVGLALALQSRALFRDDLRILVMSATLDPEPVAGILGGAPVVRSEGRQHPVRSLWRSRPVEGWIEPVVGRAVERALEETEGDVLVFLPGAGEIRRTERRLVEAGLSDRVDVLPLHGSLSGEEQDRAIQPSPPGRRKVVLASAIAETSLTIEGVRVVVDSGLMRVPRFDPGSGMSRLATVRVTRDSADQRRGRAGREAPGVCYRLWTRSQERGLVPRRSPEILEADLAPLVMELASWGAEVGELDWLDPPPPAAVRQAGELLWSLDILDGEGGLTEHGRSVARTGLHPRLGHLLVRARELDEGKLGAELVALLGERDILTAKGRAPDADLRIRVEALRKGRVSLPGHRLRRGVLARVRREARHWSEGADLKHRGSVMKSRKIQSDQKMEDGGAGPGVLAALAYPDRIGRRREGTRGRFLLRSGRGAVFGEPQGLEGEEWIVAVEVEGAGREARIFQAAPLTQAEVEEHFGHQAGSEEVVAWDDASGRVRALRVRRLGALELGSAPIVDPDPERVAGALVEGIRIRGLEALPWTRERRQLKERLDFLHTLDSEGWPPASEDALVATLEEWLRPFLAGMRSLEDLGRLPLGEALMARADPRRRRELDRLAPTHLEVPSGSRIPLDYSDPRAPVLAVRLQEVFGMTETPRVGGGRVVVTLHLLSPAHRPVQITRDLASFWRNAYFDVRKDLRGRYPKHYWPEDPLAARATRRTKPR